MLRSNECPEDECCKATNVQRTNVAEQRMPLANASRLTDYDDRTS
jgi:hypothetical protein